MLSFNIVTVCGHMEWKRTCVGFFLLSLEIQLSRRDFQRLFVNDIWYEMRGGCQFCWYCWRCWPSFFNLSLHNCESI